MIKVIVTILFKSSAAIKIIFLGLFNEIRFLFKGLSEFITNGADSLSYHIFQPIRLIRFQDVRDFLSDNYITICLILLLIIFIFLSSKKNNIDMVSSSKDNWFMEIFIIILIYFGFGYAIYKVAKGKNREPIGWLLICLIITPLIILIILAFIKKLPNTKKRRIKKTKKRK